MKLSRTINSSSVSVVMVLGNWIMWLCGSTLNEIWNYLADCWLSASILINYYIDECHMVGSLWWLSSNSKKTRSGLTTLSFCNQAGNTSFLSRDWRDDPNDEVKIQDAKKEVTTPAPADTSKNLPLTAILVETRWWRAETLWSA